MRERERGYGGVDGQQNEGKTKKKGVLEKNKKNRRTIFMYIFAH